MSTAPRRTWIWLATTAAAAAVILFVVFALGGGDDGDDLITDERTPVPTATAAPTPEPTAGPTPEPEPTPVPTEPPRADAEALTLPPQIGRELRSGAPLENRGLSHEFNGPIEPMAEGVYSLALPGAATIEVGPIPELPAGLAFSEQLRDGDLTRQMFIPSSSTTEEYLGIIAGYWDPENLPDPNFPPDRNALKAPLFEIVHLEPLGSDVDEVVATIAASDLTIIGEPQPATIGGVDAVVIEATATQRTVIAEGLEKDPGRGGQNFPQYVYEAGTRLRLYVAATPGGEVYVVAIATDEVGFEAWADLAERVLAGVDFTIG
jgi:hypothetical protein